MWCWIWHKFLPFSCQWFPAPRSLFLWSWLHRSCWQENQMHLGFRVTPRVYWIFWRLGYIVLLRNFVKALWCEDCCLLVHNVLQFTQVLGVTSEKTAVFIATTVSTLDFWSWLYNKINTWYHPGPYCVNGECCFGYSESGRSERTAQLSISAYSQWLAYPQQAGV